MTPKQKAEELYVGYWYLTNDSRIAKQCALTSVNETLSFVEDDREVFNWKEYYKEVKQQIELL